MYLGAKLETETFEDGTLTWGPSPAKYVQHAALNVKTYLMKNLTGRYSLPKWAGRPFPFDFDPEVDVSTLLEPSVATYYMELLGILSRDGMSLGRSTSVPRYTQNQSQNKTVGHTVRLVTGEFRGGGVLVTSESGWLCIRQGKSN